MHVPLHNLLTRQAVDREVSRRLLNCLETGEKVYRDYRQDVFVERTKKVSATISKRKLPKFSDQYLSTTSSATILKQKTVISPKDVAEAQRNIDIVKERGMSMSDILAHNLLDVSPLFNGDLPASVDKSALLAEMEPRLDLSQWSTDSLLSTHVIVDFMSKMRQFPLSKFANFDDVINTFSFKCN